MHTWREIKAGGGGGGEATGASFSFIINANFYFTLYSPVPPNAHFSYSSLGAQREFCIFGLRKVGGYPECVFLRC